MGQSFGNPETLPIVRDKVRSLLTKSESFRALSKEQRNNLAHDMVKVANYIAGGESKDTIPGGVTLAGDDKKEEFSADAARQGVDEYTRLVQEVNFPEFVAGLIDGVFKAIVDSSIQQMEAYASMVANISKSVDQYMKDNVTENQARDYLVNTYPNHLELDLNADSPKVKPRDDYDEDNLPDFFSDLGLGEPVDDIDEAVVEEKLVPATRRKIAMDRQQLLATMVMMGINRLVVTDGRIQAKVIFELETTDSASKSLDSKVEHKHRTYRKDSGGWFSSSYSRTSNKFKVTTVNKNDSDKNVDMKAKLSGDVNIRFKSDYFPLERMVDVLGVEKVREKAPGYNSGQTT